MIKLHAKKLKRKSSSEEDEAQEFRIIDLSKKPNDFFINFMASLQKYKLKKVSCEKIEGTIAQYSSDKFFSNFLVQLNREIVCKDKCGKCFKETALYESVPFWLIHELKKKRKKKELYVLQSNNLKI